MPNIVYEQRVRAAWSARAAAAGLSCGAMLFCVGAGVAVNVSLNAAPLCALPALALCPLFAWRVQRVLRRPKRADTAAARAVYALLALTLCLCAAYIAGAQVNLAEYTLLARARMNWIIAVTLIGIGTCALSGSTAAARMCYLLRWALPLLLFALGAKALQKGHPIGFFPVLGAGAGPLGICSLCMLCGATPALLLLAPAQKGENDDPALVPGARFLALRVLAGGAVGAVMLFSLTVCNTYDTLMSLTFWGERMLIVCTHEPRLGIPQMALLLLQLLALWLGSVSLLCGAERAAAHALKRDGGSRLPFAVCMTVTGCALLAMNAASFNRSVYAAPVLILPALQVALLCGLTRQKAARGPGERGRRHAP